MKHQISFLVLYTFFIQLEISMHFAYSWKTECIKFPALTEGFPQGFTMALKRRRATSPSSSVSGGDFDDNQTSSSVSSVGRKRRRTANIPTVDPVNLFYKLNILFRNLLTWSKLLLLEMM